MKRDQSVPAADTALFQSLMSQGCSAVEAARIAAEQDGRPRPATKLGRRVAQSEITNA